MKAYTDKSNARRAARKAAGDAGCPDPKPGEDFTLITLDDGRHTFKLASAWAPEATAEPETAAPEVDVDSIIGDADVDAMASTTPPGAKAPKAPKPPRKSVRDRMIEDAEAGKRPEQLTIQSAANASYQTRADAIFDLGTAGELAALQAYEVKGVNTYGKALINYRDAWIAYLMAPAGAI